MELSRGEHRQPLLTSYCVRGSSRQTGGLIHKEGVYVKFAIATTVATTLALAPLLADNEPQAIDRVEVGHSLWPASTKD
jgi:hypothetical protein